MIINDVDGLMKSVELCTDDLKLVVAAANISSHMEKAEKIYINSDSVLANFCIEVVERYYSLYLAFPEFVQDALMNEFYMEVTE